jgi:hypothetical protein
MAMTTDDGDEECCWADWKIHTERMPHVTNANDTKPAAVPPLASLNHQTHPRTSPPPTQTHATCLFLFPLPNELTSPGPSRCFPFWQEVLACYVTNTSAESPEGKVKCQPVLEDYYECLHHKKEVRSIYPVPSPLYLSIPLFPAILFSTSPACPPRPSTPYICTHIYKRTS